MKLTKQQIKALATKITIDKNKELRDNYDNLVKKSKEDFYKTPNGKIYKNFLDVFTENCINSYSTSTTVPWSLIPKPKLLLSSDVENKIIISTIEDWKSLDEIIDNVKKQL